MGRVVFHKERHVIKVIDYSHTPHEVACMMFPSQAFQKLEPNFIHYFLAQENSVLVSGLFDSHKGPAIVRVILAVVMLFMIPLDCSQTYQITK